MAFLVALGACSAPACNNTEDPPSTAKAPEPPKPVEPPAADADRPAEFPAPGSEAPSYLIDVYNLNDVPCEYTLAPSEEFPKGEVPVRTAEPLAHTKLRMYEKEMLYLRPVGKDRFGSGAGDPDKDGSAIVMQLECRGISMADAGYTKAELAEMRPHKLEACCTKCDGLCEGCTIPEDDTKCTAEQTVEARCTLYEDIMDCRSVESLEEPGLGLMGK